MKNKGNDIAVDPNLGFCTFNDAEGVCSTLGSTPILLPFFRATFSLCFHRGDGDMKIKQL